MSDRERAALSVGLIGLGLMGRGIGHSLLRAGHRLGVVAHRRRGVADELVALGAWEAPDPRGLAEQCEAVVLCLPSTEATDGCLHGPFGIDQAAHGGLLVIECSTLLPEAAERFAEGLARKGIGFVDAPLTRGPREAMEGRLNALVGGAPDDVERAAGVLIGFCETVFRLGGCGSGYAAKLVNNFLAFSNLVAVAEAMTTAARAGLPLDTLLDAIRVSGGQNRVLDGLAPWLAQGGDTRSLVTLGTARKDVRYYQQFARALGTAGPAAGNVLDALNGATAAGLGDAFTPAYLEFVARSAGVSLPNATKC